MVKTSANGLKLLRKHRYFCHDNYDLDPVTGDFACGFIFVWRFSCQDSMLDSILDYILDSNKKPEAY